MFKTLNSVLLSILVSSLAFAQAPNEGGSNVKASVEAGYTSSYVVNGLSKTGSEAFAGFDIGSSYYGVDAYLAGTALTSGSGFGDVHLSVGLGKDFAISSDFSLRADLVALQHQTAASANSTETRIKLAIDNPYVTPYVSGVYDITLDQYGYIVGLQKTVSIFGFVNLTPVFEYGQLTDYDVIALKLRASKVLFNRVEIFGEAAWLDNDFKSSEYNFANKEFSGDIVGTAGLRWTF